METYEESLLKKRENIGCGLSGDVDKFTHHGKELVAKQIRYSEQSNTMLVDSLREIAFLNYLDHPSIIKPRLITKKHIIFDLHGLSLYHWIKSKQRMDTKFTEDEIRHVAKQCLLALDYMNKAKVVHLDIKPDNILIEYDNKINISNAKVILCDFNISTLDIGDNNRTEEVCAQIYRAPECFNYKYSHKSDIWSLACVLWEMYLRDYFIKAGRKYREIAKDYVVFGRIIQRLGMMDQRLIDKYKVQHYINSMSYNDDQWTINKAPMVVSNIKDRLNSMGGFGHLLSLMLEYDYDKRISAADALNHPWIASTLNNSQLRIAPTISLKTTNSYLLVDEMQEKHNLSDIVVILTKNLLNHLNLYTEYNQWIVLCMISSLTDQQELDFYAHSPDPSFLNNSYKHAIDFIIDKSNGKLIQC